MSRLNRVSKFQRLRLILPDADQWTTLQWVGWLNGYETEQGNSALENLPSGEQIEIVVPARRVSIHRITLPAQSGRYLDALITQALEDRLLGDRADILAIPGPQTGTERLVWVSSRRWFDVALERLRAVGIYPTQLLPEVALLPLRPDTCVYAETASGMVFRTPGNAFGLASDETTLDSLVGAGQRERIADLYLQPWPDSWPSSLPQSLNHSARRRFDPQSCYPAIKWAAFCSLLVLISDLVHWQELEGRERRLQHEIRQTFATTFPGTPLIDPILQWESKLREAGPARRDALDAVLSLATRLNAPVRPRQIEAGEGFVRLTLSESEVAQFRTQLESVGKPEISPSELGTGLLRLHYRNAP